LFFFATWPLIFRGPKKPVVDVAGDAQIGAIAV